MRGTSILLLIGVSLGSVAAAEPAAEGSGSFGRYRIAPSWSISPDIRVRETVVNETLGASTYILNGNGLQSGNITKRVFMDLHFAYEATPDLDLSFSIENLTDEDAVEISSPVAGRREVGGRFVGLGLNYRF